MLKPFADTACLVALAFCLAGCKPGSPGSSPPNTGEANTLSARYLGLMNTGKGYLDQGDATNALVAYAKAQTLAPNDPDLWLNQAIAHLMGGNPDAAIPKADEALRLEPDMAAAHFIKGSAHLRLSNAEAAVKALENARRIDPGETATLFQLGMARMGLKQWDAAVTAFRDGLALDPNHLHSAAHYQLAQALLRAGRQAEAAGELEQHESGAEAGGPAASAATFERSKYTRARVPFRLDQPDRTGIAVRFVDASRAALGAAAQTYSGPLGLIDLDHKGSTSLFVVETGAGFRLLRNVDGVFQPSGPTYPGSPDLNCSRMLVGDLQNDRFDDVVVLGGGGSRVFKFGTNGLAMDVSSLSRLGDLKATDGVLMDLDFTGKLDLVAVTSPSQRVQVYRQLGPLLFTDITGSSGVPESLQGAQAVVMEDWNRDENMDLIAGRAAGPPLLLEKQRGARLVPREQTNWVAGATLCAGDFDNDLRPDLAIVGNGMLTICFNGGQRQEIALPVDAAVRQLIAIDYDNDGWLDLWAVGNKIRVWRNLGLAGFEERTRQLGLDSFEGGAISEIHFADFDRDCDPDVILALKGGGLRYLRNEGGNANSQIKLHLFGNRSNAGGLGCKVEIAVGGLRLMRTVSQLPVEVGVGRNQKLDSLLVHWFNWPQGFADLDFSCREPLFAGELTLQEGSCPYLYAWDGKAFQFITDILGAAPLGLPIAEGRYIESDPEELVWIGNEQTFLPRDGSYQLRITEELREVLYLDEAKLVVVDHYPGTEVHSMDKLLPGGPFPPGSLLTLHREHPLQNATTLEGREVTAQLRSVDGHRVSPPRLRAPQLRGLAEPHGLVLDFGPLDTSRPLALVLNGWIRFGGGMANIAASQDPALPFPFPSLEAEIAPGVWKPVAVTVGAPAGKTKTIVVDLDGKLEAGTRRLRLTEAFEIHWDRIALMEKQPNSRTTITFIPPTVADLHFRGFSPLKDLPTDCPPTPDYATVSPNSYWTLTPGGWCTRYGDVSELVASRDEGLALINGGDELSLEFAASALPPTPPGALREFFLYADGWDKDSDFHVATGTQVAPLPFHGLQDQAYGRQPRPRFPSDALHQKYNIRWVEGRVVRQAAQRAKESPTMLPGM